jgi:NAD(P)-dependent dehydrogenase (short-subunit alcohol dehydrogenase family)
MWYPMSTEDPPDIAIPDGFPLPSTVHGKRVIVTGAGRGLGRVLTTALARSGAIVGLVGRNEELLRKVALTLPGEHVVMAGDVRDESFGRRIMENMVAETGGVDAFIANAGVSPVLTGVERTKIEDWETVISTNLTGAFLGARAAAGAMAGGGRIIFVSSALGQRSMSGLGAYSASKAGVESLVRTMALELGSRAITVNAVAPGWFDSPLAAGFKGKEHLDRQIIGHTALGRWGRADDLPGLFMFLVSDASQFITGAVIPVDGGYLLP